MPEITAFTPSAPSGLSADALAGLLSVRDIPHYGDKNSVFAAMLRDIVSVIPCFDAMSKIYDDDTGNMKFVSGENGGALIGHIRQSGVPLLSEKFPPFVILSGGDKDKLPSVRVLLGNTDTFFLIEEIAPNGGLLSLAYVWHGGKEYYRKNAEAMQLLKSMVDRKQVTVSAPVVAEPKKSPVLSEKISAAVKKARTVVTEQPVKASSGIKALHEAGFHTEGTVKGPALVFTDGSGVQWTVLPENNPSLIKASSFILIRQSGEDCEEISGLSMDDIIPSMTQGTNLTP